MSDDAGDTRSFGRQAYDYVVDGVQERMKQKASDLMQEAINKKKPKPSNPNRNKSEEHR